MKKNAVKRIMALLMVILFIAAGMLTHTVKQSAEAHELKNELETIKKEAENVNEESENVKKDSEAAGKKDLAVPSINMQDPPLAVIPGVSTPDINLTLYDYYPDQRSEHVLGGTYVTGATQGLVKKELKDGLPQTNTSKPEVLTSLFGPQKMFGKETIIKCDGLFRKDSDGYYYYDSTQNYAYCDQMNKKFILYNWVAVPDDSWQPSVNVGNFFPFNPLSSDSPVIKPGRNGRLLHDLRVGGDAMSPNHGFGMSFEFNFMQPKDGKVGGKDMIFEFGGDDDVFVFIDNKLVLDIGGDHEYTEGSINFATGEVKVGPVSHPAEGYGESAKLKNILELEGTTFPDWSGHSLKFFYTDRGGASVCNIKFNTPTLPDKTLMVTKEISNTDKDKYADMEFDFSLFLKEKGNSSYRKVTASDKKYNTFDIWKEGEDTGRDGTVDKKGNFRLKPGETARFSDVPADTWYYVEETGIKSHEYDEVKVNGTEVAGFDENNNTVNKEYSAKSKEAMAGSQVAVVFTNNCSAYNKRELTVKKEMAEGQSSEDEFPFLIKLGGKPYTGQYYKNGKSAPEADNMKNGIVKLKQNETVTLCDIPSGISFEVTEDINALNKVQELYDNPEYSISSADKTDTEGKAAGVIKPGENSTVTVTNRLLKGNLTIKKIIDDVNYHNGDPVFTFRIERLNGEGDPQETFYRTVRFTEAVGKEASFIIREIPLGDYKVTELSSLRYKCEGGLTRELTLTKDQKNKTVEFINKLKYKKNFSHTDVISNEFKINADGTVSVNQNSSPAGTPGSRQRKGR